MDAWRIENGPNQKRHQYLHEFDTIRSTLLFHALAKKGEQVETDEACGKFIISQCIWLRESVGDWSVGSATDFFTILVAWWTAGFAFGHAISISQAAITNMSINQGKLENPPEFIPGM